MLKFYWRISLNHRNTFSNLTNRIFELMDFDHPASNVLLNEEMEKIKKKHKSLEWPKNMLNKKNRHTHTQLLSSCSCPHGHWFFKEPHGSEMVALIKKKRWEEGSKDLKPTMTWSVFLSKTDFCSHSSILRCLFWSSNPFTHRKSSRIMSCA